MTTEGEIAAWRREQRAQLLQTRAAMTVEEHRERNARVLAGVRILLQHFAFFKKTSENSQFGFRDKKKGHPERSEGPAFARNGEKSRSLVACAPQDDPFLGSENTAPKLFQVIAAYWPLQGEVDPRPLLESLQRAGCTLALPTVVGGGMPLEFRVWSLGDALERGPFGTQHPAYGEPVQPTVLLIPLVGFDEQNCRLGYGGGYYDRTLAAMDPRPLTIGLGFELSRLATIHPRPHDIPLDCIVTESSVCMKP